MARVWTDGVELGDLLFFDLQAGSASASVARSGTYAWAGSAQTIGKNLTAIAEAFFRFGFYRSGSLTAGKLFIWRSGSTELGSLRYNATSGFLELYTGTGTLVATGTVPIQAATWYLFEVRVKIADAGGALELRIDGTSDASFSGDTKPGAATTFDNVQWTSAGGSAVIYADDFAMNDTTGGVDDSWCGDGHVIYMKPNGNGDVSQLVGSDGNSVDNYLLVDEVPPDGDTTYVQSSVVDEYDLYNLEAYAPTSTTVLRVWGETRSRETVAASGNVAVVIKTGGTEFQGADVPLLTSYARVIGTVHTVNPDTGVAWTDADLNALQVGGKVR